MDSAIHPLSVQLAPESHVTARHAPCFAAVVTQNLPIASFRSEEEDEEWNEFCPQEIWYYVFVVVFELA